MNDSQERVSFRRAHPFFFWGMMIGVEMVRDRETREPAPELAGRVVVESLRRGLLLLGGGIHGNVLSFSPPFVITDEQVSAALSILEDVLAGIA